MAKLLRQSKIGGEQIASEPWTKEWVRNTLTGDSSGDITEYVKQWNEAHDRSVRDFSATFTEDGELKFTVTREGGDLLEGDSELEVSIDLHQKVDDRINDHWKGRADGGYAPLDIDGHIKKDYLPDIAIADIYTVDTYADMDSLSNPNPGDIAVITDASDGPDVQEGGASYIFDGDNWKMLTLPGDTVKTLKAYNWDDPQTGTVTIDYDDVGAKSKEEFDSFETSLYQTLSGDEEADSIESVEQARETWDTGYDRSPTSVDLTQSGDKVSVSVSRENEEDLVSEFDLRETLDDRYLKESNNLSDLDSNETARSNLSVYSRSHIDSTFFKIDNAFSEIEGEEARELARSNLDVFSRAEIREKFGKSIEDVGIEWDNAQTLKVTLTRGDIDHDDVESLEATVNVTDTLDDRYTRRSQNLGDLENKATARTNLDVYSRSIVNEKIEENVSGVSLAQNNGKIDIVIERSGVEGQELSNRQASLDLAATLDQRYLKESNNLSDLDDKVTARSNLGVLSESEIQEKFGKSIEDVELGFKDDDTTLEVEVIRGDINDPDVENVTATVDVAESLDKRYTQRSKNLSDLTDIAAARDNINVYSREEIREKFGKSVEDVELGFKSDDTTMEVTLRRGDIDDEGVEDVSATVDVAESLDKRYARRSENLADLEDAAKARENINVYSKDEIAENYVHQDDVTEVEWGNIEGDITDQADLQHALDEAGRILWHYVGEDVQLDANEGAIAYTGNGSVNIVLPENPEPGTVIGIADYAGSFEQYPAIIKVAENSDDEVLDGRSSFEADMSWESFVMVYAKHEGADGGRWVFASDNSFRYEIESKLDPNEAYLTEYEIDQRIDQAESDVKDHTSLMISKVESDTKTHAESYIDEQLEDHIPWDARGQADGVASLSASGKIKVDELPAVATNTVYHFDDISARDDHDAEYGDVAIVVDASADEQIEAGGATYIYVTDEDGENGQWKILTKPTDTVMSINGMTGVVEIDYSDVDAVSTSEFASYKENVIDTLTDGEGDSLSDVSDRRSNWDTAYDRSPTDASLSTEDGKLKLTISQEGEENEITAEWNAHGFMDSRYVQRQNNLGDLSSVTDARDNINVYSREEVRDRIKANVTGLVVEKNESENRLDFTIQRSDEGDQTLEDIKAELDLTSTLDNRYFNVKDNALAELDTETKKSNARANLDVYSKQEVEDQFGSSIEELGLEWKDDHSLKVTIERGDIAGETVDDLTATVDITANLDDRYTRRDQNLSDLIDTAAARDNLDVFSRTEVREKFGKSVEDVDLGFKDDDTTMEVKIQRGDIDDPNVEDVSATVDVAESLDKRYTKRSNNLSDLDSASSARENISVYDKSHVRSKIEKAVSGVGVEYINGESHDGKLRVTIEREGHEDQSLEDRQAEINLADTLDNRYFRIKDEPFAEIRGSDNVSRREQARESLEVYSKAEVNQKIDEHVSEHADDWDMAYKRSVKDVALRSSGSSNPSNDFELEVELTRQGGDGVDEIIAAKADISHNHDDTYVNKSGDTMNGALEMEDEIKMNQNAIDLGGGFKMQYNSDEGALDIVLA